MLKDDFSVLNAALLINFNAKYLLSVSCLLAAIFQIRKEYSKFIIGQILEFHSNIYIAKYGKTFEQLERRLHRNHKIECQKTFEKGNFLPLTIEGQTGQKNHISNFKLSKSFGENV